MSKKERERGREKGRESIELGYEMEKGGMILMENVRETANENGRRGEDRRRRRKREGEKTGIEGREGRRERKREREIICLSPERRTARRMSRTRGYRGTEETGLRPNMIIELGERCERSTL